MKVTIHKNQLKFFLSVLLSVLILSGCIPPDNTTTSELPQNKPVSVSDSQSSPYRVTKYISPSDRELLFEKFIAGEIELKYSYSAKYDWEYQQPNIETLYNNNNYKELALQVSAIGFDIKVAWFYLAHAAKNLGYDIAANIYSDKHALFEKKKDTSPPLERSELVSDPDSQPSLYRVAEYISPSDREILFEKFIAGEIELKYSYSAKYDWEYQQPNIETLYNNNDYKELALQVSVIGFDTKVAWFYLAHAAENLGHNIAADIYSDKHTLAEGQVKFYNLVKGIQIALKDLEYDPGIIDGKMGKETESAIKKFQKDNKLVADGTPTTELLKELLRASFTKRATSKSTFGNISCPQRKNCSEMTSCEEALYYLNVCGDGRLDHNNNGIPCEESACNRISERKHIKKPRPASVSPSKSNCHWVNGFYRKDGTYVRGHMRCRY